MTVKYLLILPSGTASVALGITFVLGLAAGVIISGYK